VSYGIIMSASTPPLITPEHMNNFSQN